MRQSFIVRGGHAHNWKCYPTLSDVPTRLFFCYIWPFLRLIAREKNFPVLRIYLDFDFFFLVAYFFALHSHRRSLLRIRNREGIGSAHRFVLTFSTCIQQRAYNVLRAYYTLHTVVTRRFIYMAVRDTASTVPRCPCECFSLLAGRLLTHLFVVVVVASLPPRWCLSSSHALPKKKKKQAVVKNVPPPQGPTGGPLRALIYDSVYDEYKVCTVFVFFCPCYSRRPRYSFWLPNERRNDRRQSRCGGKRKVLLRMCGLMVCVLELAVFLAAVLCFTTVAYSPQLQQR